MNGYQIPHFGLKRQHNNLKDEILVATDAALRSGNWVDGPFTEAFREWLKTKTKTWYAITVHSGTQALEIIALYERAQFNPDFTPKVIVPNLTYPATMNAFISTGWEVEIADTDRNGILYYNPDTYDYQCVVGLYGAAPHEDYAEQELKYNNSNSFIDGAQHWLVADGHIGEAMAISFDPTKNLPSSGNGGAIVTNNKRLYEFALDYVDNGKRQTHTYSGTNSKMSELECAHLLVRTKYIDEWQARRKQIRHYWLRQFEDLPIRCLSRDFDNHSDQKFVIYSDARDQLHSHMHLGGIETKIHYQKTLGELEVARNLKKPDPLLSTSVMLSRGVLSLPIYPELTDSEIEAISERIKSFFDK